MNADFERICAESPEVLGEYDLLPADREAVYLGGSLARGWGNSSSDIDVYIITAGQWNGPDGSHLPVSPSLHYNCVPVSPALDKISVCVFYRDDRRWDVEYWSDDQVDCLIEAVSYEKFQSDRFAAEALTATETEFIERLLHGRVVEGAGWVSRRKEQFDSSAIRSIASNRALYLMDSLAEDAVGMLDSNDVSSAVLAARLAFGYAVDALLASHGEVAQQPKWRVRRVRAVAAPELPFEKYWEIETMASYDADAPAKWVESALLQCRRIAEAVQL